MTENKLMLGTVQFGLDYGISNRNGQTSPKEVSNILNYSIENGVNFLDTARGYGESEKVLGNHSEQLSKFNIVTKIPKMNGEENFIEKSFNRSLKDLNRNDIYGIMLHDPTDVNKESFNELKRLKDIGKVKKVGASVYNSEQIDRVIEIGNVDLIQVPLNILDQRLVQSGHLKKLKDCGFEVHARSLFLQGLLFMEPNSIDSYFSSVASHLKMLRDESVKNDLTLLSLLIGFGKSLVEVDKLVIGVNNCKQLKEIRNCYDDNNTDINFTKFAFDSESNILDPSKWELSQ